MFTKWRMLPPYFDKQKNYQRRTELLRFQEKPFSQDNFLQEIFKKFL